jgi:hypothetical protein
VSDSTHNAILKVLALLLGLQGFIWFLHGLDATGFFTKLLEVVFGVVVVVTAVGFWRRRGWAFILVSVGLLASLMAALVRLIVSFDTGEHTGSRLLRFLLVVALIAYLGRWGTERRFRPHLDTDPH